MNSDRMEPKPQASGWGKAQKAAAVAIGVNVLLTLLKFGLAWWSKSLALKIEAFHSFADIGSSLAVWMAVRAEMNHQAQAGLSGQDSPAGFFQQPQRLVAIFIGLFLLAVGTLFLGKIINPPPITVSHPVPVSAAMLVMALFSFLLSRFEKVVGDKEGCMALVADSFHARVDMFGSLVVAGALLGESLGWSLDRLAAGLLAAFILSQALNVFGAVIRDMAGKEDQPDQLYREWLWLAIEKRLPGIIPRLVTLATRRMGGSPESAADRRRAGAVMVGGVLAALLIAYLGSGLFTVQANEQAIVERLGQPVDKEQPLAPGLHWRLPWPVDRARIVDTGRIHRLNVGSAVAPDRRVVLWTNQHYVQQFNLLTGENILADIGVVIHYRITNAADWLYNTLDPETVLSSVTYSLLAEEFSRLQLLPSLTSGRDELEARLTQQLIESLAPYQTGIEILSLQVRDAHPPTDVALDFEKVVSATVEYETRINEARGYANDLLPRARGEAAVKVLSAQAEKDAAKKRAAGDGRRFTSVLQAYRQAPGVTRARLGLETAEAILPGREKIIVPADAASGAMELFMTASPGRPARSGEQQGKQP